MAQPLSTMANTAMDTAALAAHQAAPQSNTEAMKLAYFDRCREWGEKKGSGDASKVGMILDTAKCGWDQLVVPSKVSEGSDAAKAYDGWRTGKKAKAHSRHSDDDKSRANRIAEINKYIKVGALPLIRDTDMGGYGVLKRAEKIIRESTDIKGEVEDLLSKVATRQLQNPAVPLADDQIIEACSPGNKREKGVADEWGDIRARMDRLFVKYQDEASNSDCKTARACVQKRIDDAGGTAADIRKREEAAKKEAAKKNGGAKKSRRR